MHNPWWAKTLRIIAIVLMSLTAVFTILGGAGTTCVALNPTGFSGKFAGIAPFQWLYILFVVVTLAFGVMGVRAVLLLARGRPNAYRYALVALVGGTLTGVIHMLVSRALRGSSMPVDMVTYTGLLTLLVFLLLRLPGIWQRLGFDQPGGSSSAGMGGGLAAITSGAVALTIQHWMGATHTIAGVNYADVWHAQLQAAGWLLVMVGMSALLYASGMLKLRAASLPPAPVVD